MHVGHADLPIYRRLLWQADITISTAHHEFFGISLLEAIYCHTFPLLPNRLSYPELLPDSYHAHTLYQDETELAAKLIWALKHRDEARHLAAGLATAVSHYDWQQVSPLYDEKMVTLWQAYQAETRENP